ncbi:MAG: methylated-DNA--[protein]-cysteine S-methyltransferase [Gammaproteobacteria bacterium]|nr:methylated-DNA--[protein]-cysteine S-methyltransferase [Gammaproteobacteria bacterium]
MLKNPPPYTAVIDSPIGAIGVVTDAGVLVGLDFAAGKELLSPGDAFGTEVARQVAAYFADPGFRFDLPFREQGTEFQKKVWAALRTIPRGGPVSYGELARRLGTAARAVGGACRANPIPLLTPCHRVVSASGIGGFHGDAQGGWVNAKHWLLAHERGERPASLPIQQQVTRQLV